MLLKPIIYKNKYDYFAIGKEYYKNDIYYYLQTVKDGSKYQELLFSKNKKKVTLIAKFLSKLLKKDIYIW